MNTDDASQLAHRRLTFAWFFALSLSIVLPVAVQAQFTYITNNGTITITKYDGPGGAVTIPDAIDGFPVTRIGSSAFYECDGLTGVSIGDSVLSIESSAFCKCTNLVNLAFGNGVTNIGDYAFYICTSLTNVTIPKNVTIIGWAAFANCTGLMDLSVDLHNPSYSSLDGVLFTKDRATLIQFPSGRFGSYTAPDCVTTVGACAFASSPRLTSVLIPQNVTNIGFNAFYACPSLSGITVNDLNSFYSSLEGVLLNKNQTTIIRCPEANYERYIVPATVTNIGEYAFAFCCNLTNVTIPEGVTAIRDGAFQHCEALISLEIPDSIITVRDGAFAYCTSLTGFTIGSGLRTIGISMFSYCSSLTSVRIPNTVTTIESSAFYFCTNLVEVTIGNAVGAIGNSAFSYCTSLTNITIPRSVGSIGYALLNCSNLKAINVDPLNLYYSSLDGVLFNKAQTRLVQFPGGKPESDYIIPTNVASISDQAFAGCTNLSGLYFQGNAPLLGLAVFYQTRLVVYFLPGTTGWGKTYGGRPAALWLPRVVTNTDTFGIHNNQFAFTINWANGMTTVVEACTNLANPVWSPVATNTVSADGTFQFTNLDWTNHPARLYRVRWP